MKEKNGVSMITLVITIIVIIILASVAFNSSTETIGTANYSNYVNNVSEVQQAFSLAVANRKGEEAQKGKVKKTEQVVNAVATGSTTYKLNSEAKALAYTIIDESAETELGIELPKMTVETLKESEVEVKYAVTPDGTVFAWPPIENGGTYYAAGEVVATMTESSGTLSGTITIPGSEPLAITMVAETGAISAPSGDGTTTASRDGLNIGDYVNYTPSTSTTSKTLTTTETGYSSTQTISQETLSWQILDIESDGTVKLISTPTSRDVELRNADGYNGGVKALNDVCKALYSNTAHNIVARSVNYEDDYEPYLTTAGKTIRDAFAGDSVAYGNTNSSPYTSYRQYPRIYELEIGAGIDTSTVRTTGLAGNESFTSEGDLEVVMSDSLLALTALTCTQTYWGCDVDTDNFGEQGDVLNKSTTSWLASRCVHCVGTSYDGYAMFALRGADSILNGFPTFISDGGGDRPSLSLRAVVTLGSDVNITPCTGTNSTSNTHTIAW